MDTQDTPAEIVKRARKIKGLTQSEFGDVIGRPQSLVSKYESGLVEPPGHVIIHCMTISEREARVGISSAEVAHLINERLGSPDFAKLRSALAYLIESVSQ
jgi:predicted transcriptional regulator